MWEQSGTKRKSSTSPRKTPSFADRVQVAGDASRVKWVAGSVSTSASRVGPRGTKYEVHRSPPAIGAVCDARLSHTVSLFPLQKASWPWCYQNLPLLLVLPIAIPATAYVTMTRPKTRPIQKFAKAVSQCSAEVSDRSFTLPASPCHIPKLPLY